MKNWKTNLSALLSLTTVILSAFHVITPEQCVVILGGIVTYLGAVSKDFNSTGK